MRRSYLRGLGVGAVAVLMGALASSQGQQVPIQIDDNGVVIPAHQQRHAKNGQTLRWARQTGAGSWHVVFRESPCANGTKEFGTVGGRRQTCTISVQCAKAGDPGCKTYHYTSALSPNATPHDPDVIVDN
jgi:hypothetical protein